MNYINRIFFINIFLFSIILCNSDSFEKILNFTISTDRATYRESENLELKINFSVEENYHIYSNISQYYNNNITIITWHTRETRIKDYMTTDT